jgi:hypothetical protein
LHITARTCYYWLHIEEDTMRNALQAEAAGTRAAGQPSGAGTTLTPGRRWRPFALLVAAYFITIVDFTIVNVALPTIGRRLTFPSPSCSGWSPPTG